MMKETQQSAGLTELGANNDGQLAAVMPCVAVVSNVYDAYRAGVKAERERELDTQQEAVALSHLSAELGMACVGCVSEFKNELRCYDCTVASNGKGSKFLDVEDLPEPTTEKNAKTG